MGSPLESTISGASWVGASSPGPFLGETKMWPGAVPGRFALTLMAGGRRSGRERKVLACPGSLGCGGRLGARARLATKGTGKCDQSGPGREGPEKPPACDPCSESPFARLLAQIRPLVSNQHRKGVGAGPAPLHTSGSQTSSRAPHVLRQGVSAGSNASGANTLLRGSALQRGIFHEKPQICKISALPSPSPGGNRRSSW